MTLGRKKKWCLPYSAMLPIELTREALRMILGYEVQFEYANVVAEGGDGDLRGAKLTGRVISFNGPWTYEHVESTFSAYTRWEKDQSGRLKVEFKKELYYFSYDEQYRWSTNSCPLTKMSGLID